MTFTFPCLLHNFAIRLMALCEVVRMHASLISDASSFRLRWLGMNCRGMLRAFILFLFAAVLLHPSLLAGQTSPQNGRPLLFLPGWCASPNDWNTLAEEVAGSVGKQSVYANQTLHLVYYDGTSVKLWPSGYDFYVLQPSERFFALVFFGGPSNNFSSSDNPITVAGISVLNKADEVAQVIRAITTLTNIKDVNVVAHSMGGLDARAYMQGMAVPYNNAVCTTNVYACLNATTTPFGRDIHKLITLDTPHIGAQIANNTALLAYLAAFLSGDSFGNCAVAATLNRHELEEHSSLVNLLNANPESQLPAGVPIAAITSHSGYHILLAYQGDDIVGTNEQSIATLLPGDPSYFDHDNDDGGNPIQCPTSGLSFLHSLNCLDAQPTTAPALESEITNDTFGSYSSIQVHTTLDGAAWSGSVHYSITGQPARYSANGVSQYGTTITLTDTGCASPCIFNNTYLPMYSNIPTGEYTLSSVSGGPSTQYTITPDATQTLDVDPATGANNWSLVFTIAFTGTTTQNLTVNSTNPSSGVEITVLPVDNNAKSNGTTSFVRTYNQNTQVTLTAPATVGGNSFSSWTGCDPPSSSTCTVTMTSAKAVTANYGTSTTPIAHFTMSGQGYSANDGGTLTLSVAPSSGTQVTFTSTGTQGSAAITSYVWKSNGAQVCTGSPCTTTLGLSPGASELTTTISLTVTDSGGQSSTATGTLVLKTPQAGPIAHFTMSGQGYSANDGGTLTLSVASGSTAPVTFTSTGTAGSASISSYVWKSNGGQICPGTGSTCTQSFGPGSGQFTAAIALVVTDSNAQSSTATGTVVVNTQSASTTATPTFSLASGTYTGTQTVSLSDATPGATIYYTVDGSTPTTSSNVRSTPFTLPSGTTVTLKAIAQAAGYATSAVATASYTINYPLPSVTGVQVIPSPVNSGNSATVTINLSGPAPSGGAVVSLSSANTSAFPLPSTFTVLAGQNSGSFGNQAGAVSSTTYVTVTATYNGSSQQTNVTVNPAAKTTPVVNVMPNPTSITTAQQLSVTVSVSAPSGKPTPTGIVYLTINGNPEGQTLVNGSTTYLIPAGTLPVGNNQTLTATYSYDFNSSAIYNNASGSGTVTVTLAKYTPTVNVMPVPFNLTTAQAMVVTVSVGANSGSPTPTGSVSLTATNVSQNSVLTNGSATFNIPAGTLSVGNNQMITSTYTPDSNSSSIYNSATGSNPVTVTAAKTTPTITWATPAAIIYGTPLSTTQQNATASVAGTYSYSPQPGTVLTAGSQTLNVTFTPSDTTDYNTATKSVTLTVNKATPTINWNTPAAVTVGTVLSSTQLNPTASVTGNFSYNPTSGTVMSTTGNITLTAYFAPNDTTDYNNASDSVVLTVTAALVPSFTISGTAATVTPGATTANTSTITLTPAGGFTGSVALTAAITSSPTGAQYLPTLSFGSTNPVSITGTTAGTATLTISTTAATSAALVYPKRPGVPWYTAGGATLACLLLFGIPARRRNWRTILGMLTLLVALTGGVVACGGGGSGGIGGGNSNPGTTAGTYTVTVTGTSGTTTETGTLTLTVQ